MSFIYNCLSYSKLGPEEQKDWEKKLIAYANYVNITDNVLVIMMQIVKQKLPAGTAQKVVLASCDAVSAGLLAAYNEFKKAYGEVQQGNPPDFSGTIPFPPPPPSPPSDKDAAISWFQLAWNVIRDALNVAAQKSPKLAEIVGPLDAAGNKLVEDLDKYFGAPSPPDLPTVFPTLR